jgi:poly-gamma-glutamate synthesis protein (capsule biosynthesis protein)
MTARPAGARPVLGVMVAAVLLLAACSTPSIGAGRADPADAGNGAQPQTAAVAASSPSRSSAAPTTPTEPPAPTTTISSSTTTEPERSRLVINAVGDTNVDTDYIPTLGAEGFEHAFSGLGAAFLDDDLTIVNLECAATDIGAPTKTRFNFNCDLDALPVLRESGVEVANLANNHGADYGMDALLDTKGNVTAAGLVPVGVGRDEVEAHEPAILDIGGWTIAVLGFNGVMVSEWWAAGPHKAGMADGRVADTMAAAVAAAQARADLVLVTLHWGFEGDLTPRQNQLDLADAMIEAGADAIFGHHAHRLQPLEVIDGVPVAWGLGNFVWPRLSELGARSAIARLTVEPDGTLEACLVPVIIESHGHPVIQNTAPDDGQMWCPASPVPG